MPIDFGDHGARLVPTRSVILEAMIKHDRLGQWPVHRTFYQVVDLPMLHSVGRNSDGVGETFRPQKLAQRQNRECGIATICSGLFCIFMIRASFLGRHAPVGFS